MGQIASCISASVQQKAWVRKGMLKALYARVSSALCHGNCAQRQKALLTAVLNLVTLGFVGQEIWDRIRALQ